MRVDGLLIKFVAATILKRHKLFSRYHHTTITTHRTAENHRANSRGYIRTFGGVSSRRSDAFVSA